MLWRGERVEKRKSGLPAWLVSTWLAASWVFLGWMLMGGTPG